MSERGGVISELIDNDLKMLYGAENEFTEEISEVVTGSDVFN
jgi:hypothetical protein